MSTAKQARQLAPLLPGWADESSGKMYKRLTRLIARRRVCLRRSEVFKELTYKFCAHALINRADHSYRPLNAARQRGDDIARANFARGFHAVPSDLHMSGVAGFGCQGTTLVKPHRPKPLVHTDRCLRLHGARLKRQ